MSFLGWTFLFGALAVVGPIAAHLLSKPRFRRVPFTMLRFLRSGQRASHSRRRLRDLLVLLLRCAAVVLIAVLFARPMLHVTPEPPERRSIHYLALDDSMSMAYRDGSETLLARMVDAAVEHVRRAPDDGTFNLCALASGRFVYDLNKSQAIAEIKRLKPVPRSASLEGFFSALRQASRAVAPDDTLAATIFSDSSPNVLAQFAQVPQPAVVDEVHYEPIVPSGPIDNAAVIGARIVDATDRQLSLDVTVVNHGSTGQQRTLTAQVLGSEPVVQEVRLAPSERDVVRVQMNLGSRSGRTAQTYLPIELTLSPEDGLVEDDTYRIAAYLPAAGGANLLLVGQGHETFLFETAVKALSTQGRLDNVELRKVTEDRLALSDLTWANITVFASLPRSAVCSPAHIERYLRAGGRLISFAPQPDMQNVASTQVAERLWQAGLLPSLPDRWIGETVYLDVQPVVREWPGLDERAAQSLVGYRLDRIAAKGTWQCRVDPVAHCIWRFADGVGFIYGKTLDQGASLFINTSIDDSLGLLAKSRAWVAFCHYLLGGKDQVRQFCFSTSERPVLHLAQRGLPAQLGVENSDGRRATARLDGATLRFGPPAGIGWMTTLDGPPVYAAINLPDGETELSVPATETMADAVRRTFDSSRAARYAMHAGQSRATSDERRDIWKIVAWAAIALLLAESALANRLKR